MSYSHQTQAYLAQATAHHVPVSKLPGEVFWPMLLGQAASIRSAIAWVRDIARMLPGEKLGAPMWRFHEPQGGIPFRPFASSHWSDDQEAQN